MELNNFKEHFQKIGNKEYILWYLYDKVISSSDIDKELNLGINVAQKIITERAPDFFQIDHKEGNKKFWKISYKGKLFVENVIKELQINKEQLDELKQQKIEHEDIIELLKEFIDSLKLNYFKLEKENNISIKLDFNKLLEFNPDLCDYFLDEYESTKEYIIRIIEDNLNNKNKIINLRPFNLPKYIEVDLENLSASKHFNKLIKTKAVIEYRGDTKEGMILKSKFECPSCGSRIKIKHDGDVYKTPRCSCGRKSQFRLLEEESTDFLEIIIRNKDISKIRTRMYLELKGNDQIEYLNKHLGNGKVIEVLGVYKARPIFVKNRKTNRFSNYIIAENIKALDEDLVNMEISKEEEEKIKKLAEDFEKEEFKNIIPAVFPATIHNNIGQEVLSKVFILQMVTGGNVFNEDMTKEISKMSVFCYGDPAVNKSRRIEYMMKRVDNRIRTVNGSTTSTAGLLLGMDTFENKRFVSGGLLTQGNDSIVVIDEIQNFDKDARGALHDVLASQSLRYTKIGFHFDEDINICMSFLGNPKGDKFKDKPIYEQIQEERNEWGKVESYNYAFLSRCDFVVGIRDSKNKIDDMEIANSILSRSMNESSKKSDKDIFRKYIFTAKRFEKPQLLKQSINLISELVSEVRSSVTEYNITHRVTEAYRRSAECFARLRLSRKIEEIDVLRTHKLYLDSLKSLDIPIRSDMERDYNSKRLEGQNPQEIEEEEVKNSNFFSQKDVAIFVLEQIKNSEIANEQELYNKVCDNFKDMSSNYFDEIINRLSKEGEIFKPKEGFLKLI